MSAIFRGLEGAGVGVFSTALLNSAVWTLQKPDCSWQMTVAHQRLHQVVPPSAASGKDGTSFPELVNIILGIWDVAIHLAHICIHGLTPGLC